jgi:hypothetical protein
MKRNLLIFFIAAFTVLISDVMFGQAPNLGTTSGFALFTAVGAFNNDGESVVTGNVGTNAGAFNAFPPGTLVGTKHVVDGVSVTAATDVATAYSSLAALTPLDVIGVGLGGQILGPGVHSIGAAATLAGVLTLDGGGDPDALFIIKINGALATAASSTVSLINSANVCNVYWQINGQVDLETNSVFVGTIIAAGPINLFVGSSLSGRGLSTEGAISLHTAKVTVPVCACSLPDVAGNITGSCNKICPGQTGVSFSVPVIPNATGYIWNLPDGATITSGANTNSILVNYSLNAVGGNVTVKGSNLCGNGLVSAGYEIMVNPLPAAPRITLIQPTSTEATGTITVTDPTGYYIVYSINGLNYTNETGIFRGVLPGTYTVTAKILLGCVGPGTSATINNYVTGIEGIRIRSTIEIFPVPNDGRFTVVLNTLSEKQFDILIGNALGSKIYEEQNIIVNGNLEHKIDISQVHKGMYFIKFRSGDEEVVRKILITK